jgi:hypothetical protein
MVLAGNILEPTEPAANNWYNETDADGLGMTFDGWAGINTYLTQNHAYECT